MDGGRIVTDITECRIPYKYSSSKTKAVVHKLLSLQINKKHIWECNELERMDCFKYLGLSFDKRHTCTLNVLFCHNVKIQV